MERACRSLHGGEQCCGHSQQHRRRSCSTAAATVLRRRFRWRRASHPKDGKRAQQITGGERRRWPSSWRQCALLVQQLAQHSARCGAVQRCSCSSEQIRAGRHRARQDAREIRNRRQHWRDKGDQAGLDIRLRIRSVRAWHAKHPASSMASTRWRRRTIDAFRRVTPCVNALWRAGSSCTAMAATHCVHTAVALAHAACRGATWSASVGHWKACALLASATAVTSAKITEARVISTLSDAM